MIFTDEKQINLPHSVIIEDRNTIKVTGVTEVGKFDEKSVVLFTTHGETEIKGEELHVIALNIDKGEVVAEGRIDSVIYSETVSNQGGFFARMFS